MAVLDGTEVVYVSRVVGPRYMTVSINVGSRMPAHLTSVGRVLLADLPEEEFAAYLEAFERTYPTAGVAKTIASLRLEVARAREVGWAVVDQELEQGLRAIAAPVRDTQRACDRRRRTLHPRGPAQPRIDARRPPAGAPHDREADRDRPAPRGAATAQRRER